MKCDIPPGSSHNINVNGVVGFTCLDVQTFSTCKQAMVHTVVAAAVVAPLANTSVATSHANVNAFFDSHHARARMVPSAGLCKSAYT